MKLADVGLLPVNVSDVDIFVVDLALYYFRSARCRSDQLGSPHRRSDCGSSCESECGSRRFRRWGSGTVYMSAVI